MDVAAISANAIGTGTAAAPSSDSGQGDTAGALRENFMTMLVTQLRNQDPMNPLENNQLTSQLAQINTVNGVDALNETLNGITAQIDAGQSLQAASLIDRGVLTQGNRVMVGSEGVSTPFGVELDDPAETLTAQVVGSDGSVLYEQEREALEGGVHTFRWNGERSNGETVEPGAYEVRFSAEGSDEQRVNATPLEYGEVRAVNVTEGDTRLDLGGVSDPVTMDEVRKIL